MSEEANFKKVIKKLKKKFDIQERKTNHVRYEIMHQGRRILWLNKSHTVKHFHQKL